MTKINLKKETVDQLTADLSRIACMSQCSTHNPTIKFMLDLFCNCRFSEIHNNYPCLTHTHKHTHTKEPQKKKMFLLCKTK